MRDTGGKPGSLSFRSGFFKFPYSTNLFCLASILNSDSSLTVNERLKNRGAKSAGLEVESAVEEGVVWRNGI